MAPSTHLPRHLARPRLTREEAIGLGGAVLLHAALIGWMALEPWGKRMTPPPERMTVTLTDEVAPDSTSPEPAAVARPELAPARGEPAPAVGPEPEPAPVSPPPPAPVIAPQPKPAPRALPAPPPRPMPKPVPAARPQPAPAPAPRAIPRPPPPRPAPPRPRPAAAAPRLAPAPRPAAKPAPPAPAKGRVGNDFLSGVADRQAAATKAPSGASRLGNDFLKGVPAGDASAAKSSAPAAAAGPQVLASLAQGIARQLKPHWVAPQGVDAEKLVTVLAWELNPDGSLAGRPRVVSQSGVTPANQAQKDRHAEQAIRAVQLAAPFQLPAQYYAQWRRVTAFKFDRKLSQ